MQVQLPACVKAQYRYQPLSCAMEEPRSYPRLTDKQLGGGADVPAPRIAIVLEQVDMDPNGGASVPSCRRHSLDIVRPHQLLHTTMVS